MKKSILPPTYFFVLLGLSVVTTFFIPFLMYLGMAAVLLGIAILSQALIAFLFPVLFIIIIERKFIPIEEGNLRQVFGAKYSQYRAQVRRWL